MPNCLVLIESVEVVWASPGTSVAISCQNDFVRFNCRRLTALVEALDFGAVLHRSADCGPAVHQPVLQQFSCHIASIFGALCIHLWTCYLLRVAIFPPIAKPLRLKPHRSPIVDIGSNLGGHAVWHIILRPGVGAECDIRRMATNSIVSSRCCPNVTARLVFTMGLARHR